MPERTVWRKRMIMGKNSIKRGQRENKVFLLCNKMITLVAVLKQK
jgi:hypothetical protein